MFSIAGRAAAALLLLLIAVISECQSGEDKRIVYIHVGTELKSMNGTEEVARYSETTFSHFIYKYR